MADRKKPISQLDVNEQEFIFNPNTGQSYTTNAQGRLIIQALDKDEPAEAILDQILELFQVSSQEAERDLEEFMDHLRCLGLVT